MSEPAAPTNAPAVEGIVPPVTPRVFVATPVSTEVPIVHLPPEPRAGQPAPKPPFLASEILHEDLMPTEPGRRALTQTMRVFGGWGLLVALWGRGSAPFALVSVGALALLVTSVLRVPHITRAVMVASISGAGLCIAGFWKAQAGGALEDALLAASTTLLASALLFRACIAARMRRVRSWRQVCSHASAGQPWVSIDVCYCLIGRGNRGCQL